VADFKAISNIRLQRLRKIMKLLNQRRTPTSSEYEVGQITIAAILGMLISVFANKYTTSCRRTLAVGLLRRGMPG
jgi:hypothetical protein